MTLHDAFLSWDFRQYPRFSEVNPSGSTPEALREDMAAIIHNARIVAIGEYKQDWFKQTGNYDYQCFCYWLGRLEYQELMVLGEIPDWVKAIPQSDITYALDPHTIAEDEADRASQNAYNHFHNG